MVPRAGSITGATGPSYTAVAADDAQKLWAKVTLSAPGFTSVVLTSAQVSVGKGSFVTAPVPTISGIAKVGQLQTANADTWAPTGATLSYQWYRGTAAIVGAASRTYSTTALDYGKTLKVRVREAKAGYTTLDRDSVARLIAAGTIVATKSSTVVGTDRFEQTVKVSQGWTPGSTIRYQWYRNGVAVRGGTGYALYLNSSYIGVRVNVKVTVSKAGYATRSATTTAITVGKAVITLKSAPRTTGATSLGSTLTANVGTYAPAPSAYAYQWYRNGAAISGARYRTYRLTAADNGRSVTVRVSASLIYFDTRVTMSPALKLPVWPVTVLRGDGTYRVGTQIKPGLYKSTGDRQRMLLGEAQWLLRHAEPDQCQLLWNGPDIRPDPSGRRRIQLRRLRLVDDRPLHRGQVDSDHDRWHLPRRHRHPAWHLLRIWSRKVLLLGNPKRIGRQL